MAKLQFIMDGYMYVTQDLVETIFFTKTANK